MIDSPALLGLGAALAWGFVDVLVAILGRRMPPAAVALIVHVTGLAFLAVLAAVLDEPIDLTAIQWVAVVAFGPLSALAYFTFYRALALGPVAIVSPIASANGAIVVVLAVVVLGNTLSTAQATGCVLVIVCVVLAAYERNGRPAATGGAGDAPAASGGGEALLAAPTGGIRLAIIATVAFGCYLFGSAVLAESLGWLVPILLTRISGGIVLAAIVAKRRDSLRLPKRWWIVPLAVAGVLEVSGYLMFNRGAELGETAITSAAASAYPLVPMAFGFIALSERVQPHQAVGAAGVVAGMVLLGLG